MAFVGDGAPPDAYHCSANSLIVESSCPAMVLLPAGACCSERASDTARALQQRRGRPMTAFQAWISSVPMRPISTRSLQSHGKLFQSFALILCACLLSDVQAEGLLQSLPEHSLKPQAPQTTE